MPTDIPRPIIVVTGANGGVGFGICQRLLFQLCDAHPTDTLPQSFVKSATSLDVPPKCESLTLVMACRSKQRAEVARAKLLRLLDTHVLTLQQRPGYDGHAHKFRENVAIDIAILDLADLGSVFAFTTEVSSRYPYVTRLICNAGIVGFSSLDWFQCMKQMFTDPLMAITAPTYYLQHKGQMSKNGLGMIWQCNLFGHYVLYRSLQHLLAASPSSLGSRVIWMSSLEASPTFYDADDWQMKRTEHSYEGTKYQIDLLGTLLDRRALYSSEPQPTRHFVTHPGVCSTNVSHALVGPFMDMFKVLSFYIGRLCGSPHHTIDPYKAAIGAVHLALASLAFITLWPAAIGKNDGDVPPPGQPAKFSAETDRWGSERVGLHVVKEWEKQKDEGEILLAKCEALFQSFGHLRVLDEVVAKSEGDDA